VLTLPPAAHGITKLEPRAEPRDEMAAEARTAGPRLMKGEMEDSTGHVEPPGTPAWASSGDLCLCGQCSGDPFAFSTSSALWLAGLEKNPVVTRSGNKDCLGQTREAISSKGVAHMQGSLD
jgi:hypothetical protein